MTVSKKIAASRVPGAVFFLLAGAAMAQRVPGDDAELRFWLENMVTFHRFSFFEGVDIEAEIRRIEGTGWRGN